MKIFYNSDSADDFDWEAEHDKLIELEGNDDGKDKNKTLEAFEEVFNSKIL